MFFLFIGNYRGGSDDDSNRLVNQFLIEFDRMNNKKNVLILGATNRPEMIDSALLQPGKKIHF